VEARVAGIDSTRREILITSVLDAEPQALSVLPGPSIWPFLLACVVAIAFGGFMVHPAFFLVGFFLAFAVIVGWHWPGEEERLPPWKEERRS
jgi:cytochrome c oxidase subunit 1